MSGGFTLNMQDPTTRARFALAQAIAGLTIELGTGMRASRNASGLDMARAAGAIDPSRRTTKMPALKACIKAMKGIDPEYVIGERTQMILDGKHKR